MPAENPNHKPMPLWYQIAGLVGGVLVLLVVGVWLVRFGGWTLVKRALPPEWTSGWNDEPDGVRVMMPKADPNGAPWKQKAYDDEADERADDRADRKGRGKNDRPRDRDDRADDASSDEGAGAGVVASLDAAAAKADEAIAQVAVKRGEQAAVVAAEQAIDDLQHLAIPKAEASVMQAAKERRSELATEKKAALEQAKRQARATHAATKTVGLYKSGDDDSEQVAQLAAGALVHLFLDTGKGWARVEALDGDAAGQSGYVRAKALRRLER
jgi:hypothetical protein